MEEVPMDWRISALAACIVILALVSIYVPTIYIRDTKKLIDLLQKIEANTRKA